MARNSALTPEQRAAADEARLDLSAETIRLVELGLSAEGHGGGELDGVLDPELRTALRGWQGSRDIEATGFLDRQSLSELLTAGRAVEEQAEEERLEAEREAETQRLAEERRQAQQERLAEERGPVKLIDRGPYAETLIKKGLLDVSDPELECLDCADDAVLDHYWKDLYKYTPRTVGGA